MKNFYLKRRVEIESSSLVKINKREAMWDIQKKK